MSGTHPPEPPGAQTATGLSPFVTTCWSVVFTAGQQEQPQAKVALEELCKTYWRPLYAYARRRGFSPADAEDMTQAFFEHLLGGNRLASADRTKGRFRSFLLSSFNNFIADAWDKAHAKKRGAARLLQLDISDLETRLAPIADGLKDETLYDREWAIALLEKVHAQLEIEYGARPEVFQALRSTLSMADARPAYSHLAGQLHSSPGAVKVAVHRLRRRYRELLRAAVAETVSSADEVGEELQYLLRVLASEGAV